MTAGPSNEEIAITFIGMGVFVVCVVMLANIAFACVEEWLRGRKAIRLRLDGRIPKRLQDDA